MCSQLVTSQVAKKNKTCYCLCAGYLSSIELCHSCSNFVNTKLRSHWNEQIKRSAFTFALMKKVLFFFYPVTILSWRRRLKDESVRTLSSVQRRSNSTRSTQQLICCPAGCLKLHTNTHMYMHTHSRTDMQMNTKRSIVTHGFFISQIIQESIFSQLILHSSLGGSSARSFGWRECSRSRCFVSSLLALHLTGMRPVCD